MDLKINSIYKRFFQSNRYMSNTSWLVFEKLFRGILSIIVSIYVARYLGPTGFGLVNYGLGLIALFTVFSQLGLEGIVIRDLVKNEDDVESIIGSAFTMKLIASLCSIFAYLLYVMKSEPLLGDQLVLYSLAPIMLLQSFNIIDFYFKAKVRAKFIAQVNIIAFVITSILKVIFIFMKLEIIYISSLYAVEFFFMGLGYLYLIFIERKAVSLKSLFHYNMNWASRLIKNSLPLIFSALAVTIYMKSDQIMLKNMLSSKEVGIYSIALKLTEAFYFFPIVVCSSFFPAIIETHNRGNKEQFMKRLQTLYDIMFWLPFFIILPLFFLSPYIIPFLYGEEYIKAIGVLKIHVWVLLFVFLGVSNSKWFLIENKQHYSLYITVIAAIMNIILNYYFIRLWGITGAAFATLLSQIFSTVIGQVFFSSCRDNFFLTMKAMNPYSSLKRIHTFLKEYK